MSFLEEQRTTTDSEMCCDDDCCICLEKIVIPKDGEDDNEVCSLPYCCHRLHATCLSKLRACGQESSKRCPLCRAYILMNADEMNDEAGNIFIQIEECVNEGETSWDDLNANHKETLADAIKLWMDASKQGNARAQCNLGNMYRWGLGVKHSNEKAMKLYLAASLKGNANAQYHLAYSLELAGNDIDEAIYWFKKSGMQGHVRAQHRVGSILETYGKNIGETSVAESARWYLRAAKQGFYQSQCSLGILYEQGRGVEQDFGQAVRYYKLAADQGDAAALTNLGTMYNDGRGVAQSHHYAVYLYRKAARQGYARAQFNLAYKYEEDSLNMDNGIAHAVRWYRKAADQGYASAQCNLGVMYENGKASMDMNREEKYSEALKWFEKGAEQGHIDCLVNLALMNELGKGVEIDFESALLMLETAKELGCESVKTHIDRVERKMFASVTTMTCDEMSDGTSSEEGTLI